MRQSHYCAPIDNLALLRQIPSIDEREQELTRELRVLQKVLLREMKRIPIDLCVTEIRDETEERFLAMSLSEAVRNFARLDASPDPQALREEALANARQFLFSSLMPTAHLDREGRVPAKSPAHPTTGEPDEDWFR